MARAIRAAPVRTQDAGDYHHVELHHGVSNEANPVHLGCTTERGDHVLVPISATLKIAYARHGW